jgi:hypothetical protein
MSPYLKCLQTSIYYGIIFEHRALSELRVEHQPLLLDQPEKINSNVLQKTKYVYQKKGTTNVHFQQQFRTFK